MLVRSSRRRGFTLIELLIVITIILIVSVAGLSVVLPAIGSQGVTSAALLVQASLAQVRDEALRSGAPAGIRLIPERDGRFRFLDPSVAGGIGLTPAYTRMIALRQGSDYDEGQVRGINVLPPVNPLSDLQQFPLVLPFAPANLVGSAAKWRTVWESKFSQFVTPAIGVPRAPTSWYWNIRQGDKIRLKNSGRSWTIVGPVLLGPNATANAGNTLLSAADKVLVNTERYINWGSSASFQSYPVASYTPMPPKEFLIVLDGIDNDGDGYVDEAFDGVDNDGDGFVDPGFDGIDNDGNGYVDDPLEMLWSAGGIYNGGEYETEEQLPLLGVIDTNAQDYTIERRPVPAPGAREVPLPAGVVIDLTTYNPATPGLAERSRLPVDPLTGFVDVMVAPNGQVVQPIAGRTKGVAADLPFYHFWITDTEDVIEPDSTSYPRLPLPQTALGYTPSSPERVLKGNRRLLSLNTRTGQINRTTLETFDVTGLSAPPNPDTRELVIGRPFRQAEAGLKDEP